MAVSKAAGLGTNPCAAIQSTCGSSAAGAPRAAAQRRERPLGLSLLAVASAATAVALLILAGSWLGASDIVPGTRLAAIARFAAVILGLVAILQLVLAYGIWELRSWAWPLGVGVTIAAISLTVLSAGRGSPGAHLLFLLLEIGTLWYLLTEPIQKTLHSGRGQSRG
jgi:hypothetical protein